MKIKRLLEILNPAFTTKLWTVRFSGWSGGSFESFWFRKNALRRAEQYKDEVVFINLVDELNDSDIRLYDNSKKFPAPPVGSMILTVSASSEVTA